VIVLLLYLFLVGWGTAEVISTKLVPLWVGARGVEFQWSHLQVALDSNLNLVSNTRSMFIGTVLATKLPTSVTHTHSLTHTCTHTHTHTHPHTHTHTYAHS